ncbi:MAG TPA: hypothetical protein VLH40_05615, partial [Atribacteraceae bacterium]|nr:hypothetical protein [Atribacteraceae bacterium]
MAASKQFQHRIGFGVWINDFRNDPLTQDNWPCICIDQQTQDDFRGMMQFLKKIGFTAVDIFGFLTNHDWPEKVHDVVSEDRIRAVQRLVKNAHDNNLEVIYGLGVYSWGFDSIIKNNPAVRGTSPQAMCGSREESQQYMRKVVDFVTNTFNFDGFHLEVADQGRCRCALCSKETDVVYFNRLNRETAEYIRSKLPDKFLLVNTSGYLPWGDTFAPEEFSSLYELGEWIDVLIDGGNHGQFVAEEHRTKFVENLPCDYGTSGGFWIYPPQHWKRLRWFLPYFYYAADHLKKLYRDGGRACEIYLGPLLNPGTELNLWCIGNFLQDPLKDPLTVVWDAIETLYRPKNQKSASQLVDLISRAESAFFNNWSSQRQSGIPEQYSDGIESLFAWSNTKRERAIPGELFLEPLFGNQPGFPVY